ncbi:MAG: SurA N-terminal domain-containing protein [Henriciella sp.]|nr:SurA N-terminal domain-containing protein [Henriciella sp.]
MLTPLRNMLRSPWAGGIFLIVIISMAAWGVTDIFTGGSGRSLVSAGDRAVSDRVFDSTLERVLRTQTDERGRSMTKEEAMGRGIVDRLYQDLSRETLLTSYADKQGISATTGAIADRIRTDPLFQDTTGVFDPLRYSQLLDANGYREADYEADLEAEMTLSRLQRVPIEGLKVPTALARLQAAYSGELRGASWFILEESQLPEVTEPSEEELLALYESRKDFLREPERRGISLIHLTADDFISASEVTEDDVLAFYEAYKSERYTGPDTRTFTEFVFPSESIARGALGRIAGGAAADAIETALSTQERTGRRELIANDRLADQVFSPGAQEGSIHGPQPVGDQYVVIRLESITPGDATPLEDVREQIETELARDLAIGYFYDALPQFDDLLGTGADLEGIAEGIGTPVLSFAPVDANGVTKDGRRFLPLVTAPGLLQMIYAQAEGQNTERFGEDESTWLARVDSIVPERLPAFEEVRDTLIETWKQDQKANQLQAAAAEIEALIASGDSTLDQEAAKYATSVESLPRPITRTNTDLQMPRPLILGMFAANEEGETFATAGMQNQMIIMQVTSIDRPADETLDILAQSSALEIQNGVAEDLFAAYVLGISTDIELNTNGAAFEAYKRSLVTEQ